MNRHAKWHFMNFIQYTIDYISIILNYASFPEVIHFNRLRGVTISTTCSIKIVKWLQNVIEIYLFVIFNLDQHPDLENC